MLLSNQSGRCKDAYCTIFNISVCLKSFTSWILGERKLVLGTWVRFMFVSEACSLAGILRGSWSIPFSLLCAVLSCFSHVLLFVTPWTTAGQAPLSWDTPDRNTAVGCHALLQGIFPTQGSNLRLLVSCFGRWLFLPLGPLGKPTVLLGTHQILEFGVLSFWCNNSHSRTWVASH